MRIRFWGAARTVTGSMHEIEAAGQRLLLDCGLYQGRRQEAFERNRNIPIPGRKLDGVVLSHAHIDHSGNLPSLARTGYDGVVFSTPATADLCDAMLKDSAFIQEKDAEFVNRRRARRRSLDPKSNGKGEVEPLYSIADAESILAQFTKVDYHKPTRWNDELSFEYYDTGHLLGSAAVVLNHRRNGKRTRLTFSGDVGRCCLPIIRDPESMPEADYLIMESTYGNRLHKQEHLVQERLGEVVRRTAERGGRVIIPAFAVGRTQQIVLILNQLTQEGKIPNIPVFVDSPLAVNATEIYRKHPECYDLETTAFLDNGSDPFGFSRLRYIRDVEQSKALNDLHGPMVIISASGMCEAGRILHHLRNNVGDPRNTVMIVGYQAEHTLGRKLVEGWQEVPIFGDPMRVRAEVVTINELSGHADQHELMQWMKPMAKTLRKVFLVHGDLEQAAPLAALIKETHGIETVIPERGSTFDLD
ncbi:MAG: MBL fold metallo-hydrolase [Bryobacteraceae bacterium]